MTVGTYPDKQRGQWRRNHFLGEGAIYQRETSENFVCALTLYDGPLGLPKSIYRDGSLIAVCR